MAVAAKKSPYLAVAYLDDLEADGRTQVLFNKQEMNTQPQFKGVSVPVSKKGQQQSELDILAEAQKHVTPGVTLALGYDETLRFVVVYLYDISKWESFKAERDDCKGYGEFKQMRPIE